VLYHFLRALQQNRAQSRLLYLLNKNNDDDDDDVKYQQKIQPTSVFIQGG